MTCARCVTRTSIFDRKNGQLPRQYLVGGEWHSVHLYFRRNDVERALVKTHRVRRWRTRLGNIIFLPRQRGRNNMINEGYSN